MTRFPKTKRAHQTDREESTEPDEASHARRDAVKPFYAIQYAKIRNSAIVNAAQVIEIVESKLFRFDAFLARDIDHCGGRIDSMSAYTAVLEVNGIRSGPAAQVENSLSRREEGVNPMPDRLTLQAASRRSGPQRVVVGGDGVKCGASHFCSHASTS